MKDCKHELVLNKKEDFVFCKKCGKKWTFGVEQTFYPVYPQYPMPQHPDNTLITYYTTDGTKLNC